MKFKYAAWLKTTLEAIAVTALIPAACWAKSAGASADYGFSADYKLGAPNFWDYLTYDESTKRLYAAHIDRVEVIDVSFGKRLGQIGPFKDVHGIAIASGSGKGYATSGDDGVVKVFSLKDLSILQTIKAPKDADGAVYDPGTNTVLVAAGDSKTLTIIDVSRDAVSNTVALPGSPEYLAADGHGNVFVNIADQHSIARIDIRSASVTAQWPLAGCQDPHGLGYDPQANRLFSGCANGVLVVVDASNGNNLATLPIGPRSDTVVVDSVRRRAMSANADGTLTVISIGANDTYAVERTVLTFFGGRNAAIDNVTGTVFVAHGNMKVASGTKDLTQLRFAWDGLDVLVLEPNN